MKKATVKSHTRSVKGKGNSTVKSHTRAKASSGRKVTKEMHQAEKDANLAKRLKRIAMLAKSGVNKENLAMRKKDGQASRSKVGPQMVLKGNPVPKTSKKGGEGKSKKARGV